MATHCSQDCSTGPITAHLMVPQKGNARKERDRVLTPPSLEGPFSITWLLGSPRLFSKDVCQAQPFTLETQPWSRGPLGDTSNSYCNIWKTQTVFTSLFHFLWEMECFILFCSTAWWTLVSKYFPTESYWVIFEGILNVNCSVALPDTGPSTDFNSSFATCGPNATEETGVRWPASEPAAWASRQCL